MDDRDGGKVMLYAGRMRINPGDSALEVKPVFRTAPGRARMTVLVSHR
jgi:hypothetical protein